MLLDRLHSRVQTGTLGCEAYLYTGSYLSRKADKDKSGVIRRVLTPQRVMRQTLCVKKCVSRRQVYHNCGGSGSRAIGNRYYRFPVLASRLLPFRQQDHTAL